jgi:hypothetical protein
MYIYKGKGKGKFLPITGHKDPDGEQMYSSTLPSTSALDGSGWLAPPPAALPPGKTRYPLYRRLGGPQGRSGWMRKISSPPEFDPRTVQPVESRYTHTHATYILPNNYIFFYLINSEVIRAKGKY